MSQRDAIGDFVEAAGLGIVDTGLDPLARSEAGEEGSASASDDDLSFFLEEVDGAHGSDGTCLLYTSPSPRDS